ncbi:MAG: pilus assembly protein PilQ [Hydrogenothermaceae bacterium]
MKKMKLLSLALLTTFNVNAAERITAEFSGAKLSTVVESISQVANTNILWDKDAVSQKDKLIYLSIRKPIDSEKLLNLVLLENGLIAVKENDIYKIRTAEEYIVSIPPDIIKNLGKDIFDEIVNTTRKNASTSALIEADKNVYTIYVKDQKDNINKIKAITTAYIDSLKKQSEDFAKLQTEQGSLIKKEYDISYENFKAVEDKIIESLSPIGRYNYDKEKEKLTILDTKNNILNVSRILSKVTDVKMETKCFYARGLEPGEILLTIKENYLSENGTVIFKSKESLEVGGTESRQITTTGTGSTLGTTAGITKSTTQPATIITSLPKICITDTPEIVDKIKYKFSDYLLDRPYQIAIEARIVQISSKSLRDLGIQWGGSGVSGNLRAAGTNSISAMNPPSRYAVDFPAVSSSIPGGFSIGLIYGTLNNFLDIRLSALEKRGQSKILSKPQIVTIDGETAEISQGYEIPYTTAVAAGGGTVSSVSFKKAVLKLNVTPRTTADGNIIMDLILTQDIPDFKNLLLGNPPIQTKTVTSKVVAKDGSVIAIGGILEKTEDIQNSGVPGLMNIPIFGNLFKEKYKQIQDTELLIFLSPKIVYE